MRKASISIFFLLLLCTVFCGWKTVIKVRNNTNLTNNRDFICPDWHNLDSKTALYLYYNVNNVNNINSMKVYKTDKHGKRVVAERYYRAGLLVTENLYPDSADDYTVNYVYNDERLLVRIYDTSKNGYITKNWNYLYSYDKAENELVCVKTDEKNRRTFYREDVKGNEYHITLKIENNEKSVENCYLVYDENGLSELRNISHLYDIKYVIEREDNKITITGSRKDGHIFELQEYEVKENYAICNLFNFPNSKKELVRKYEFFNFDNHNNWTINKSDKEIIERIFEYID